MAEGGVTAPAGPPPALEVRGVSTWFATAEGAAVQALGGVDLAVAPGEFVSLVGASGCGKTTLLRTVDGLLPPTTGSVLVDGVPVTGPGPDRAVVFQQDALLPWRTVLDNVTFGLELRGRGRRERDEVGARLLATVGLVGAGRRYPHELSGGMRQRVNLARALAVAPAVLLLDEPFAALDALTREGLQAELLRVWGAGPRTTVLFVTHQLDEAAFLSDRVVVMTPGPGRIREVVPVPFPRPRPLALKRSPAFGRLVNRLWALIEPDLAAPPDAAPEHPPPGRSGATGRAAGR